MHCISLAAWADFSSRTWQKFTFLYWRVVVILQLINQYSTCAVLYYFILKWLLYYCRCNRYNKYTTENRFECIWSHTPVIMEICTYSHQLLKSCTCCIMHLPYRCAMSPCGLFRTAINRRFTFLYVVTFFLIFPYLFSNVRYSSFYTIGNATQAVDRLTRDNTKRIELAEQYFQKLNRLGHAVRTSLDDRVAEPKKETPTRIALTVITVSRNRHAINKYEPKYLTQIIWKYLVLIDEERQNAGDSYPLRVNLSVCNVDHDPASYQEARQIAQFVPMFNRFNATHFSMVNVLEKEKEDYVYCLNQSLVDDPDYVFLVEDDAMPTDDLFRVLRHVLHMHIENGHERGEIVHRKENVAFVKFYHPERLLSFFGVERERLSELFAYVSLLSVSLTGVYLVCFQNDSTVSVYKVWRRMATFALLVVLSIGRTGVSEWRRFAAPAFYIYTPAPSCCTPAMLFPATAARHVVSFLNSSVAENLIGKDTLLDRMIDERHMFAYLVQPNAYTHIGMYSSLRDRLVDPNLVWMVNEL